MRYKILNQNNINFITCTIVDWIDVFTRPVYKNIIIDSLKYCQEKKGLIIYAYVIMTNHIHLVVQAKDGFQLSDILRDFKKFTAHKILNHIKNDKKESRKIWMLFRFSWNASQSAGHKDHQFWRRDNHPFELYSPKLIWQKIDYIHLNPVVQGIVVNPENYIYSSASNYANQNSILEITLMDYFNEVGYIHVG